MDAPARIEALNPGERSSARLALRPLRRGVYAWPRIRVTSTFPWNIYRFRQTFTLPGEVVVPPVYRSLAGFEAAYRVGATAADPLAGLRGGAGEDYLGNREYLPGVPVRRWDYRSWARIGKPVVREYQNEAQATASLVVDSAFPPTRLGRRASRRDEEIPELEALLSLAAALSETLTQRSYRIDRLATGQNLVEFSAASTSDQQLALMEELARVQPVTSRDASLFTEEFLIRLQESPLVFLLLHQWDATRQQLYQQLTDSGTEVHCLVLNDDTETIREADVQTVTTKAIEGGEVVVS